MEGQEFNAARFAWHMGLALVLAFSFAVVGACQTASGPILSANRELGISFSPSSIAYWEYKANPGGEVLDSEHGWIARGFGVSAAWMTGASRCCNLLVSSDYFFNTGSSDHRSESQIKGGPPLRYRAPYRSQQIWSDFGPGFMVTPNLLVAGQVELRYRDWLRVLPKALLAVREDYKFAVAGAAFLADYNPFQAFVLQAKIVRGRMFSQKVSTIGNLGGPDGPVPNTDLGLGRKPYWRAALTLDEPLVARVHAFVGAKYFRFGFGESAVLHFGQNHTEIEPNSATDLFQLEAGLAWSF